MDLSIMERCLDKIHLLFNFTPNCEIKPDGIYMKNKVIYTNGRRYGMNFYEIYFRGKREGYSLYIYDLNRWSIVYNKNGKYHGINRLFNRDNLIRLYTYRNGILHGDYKSFYENGMIEIEGKYYNERETGKWRYYNEEGNQTYTLYYIRGSLINFWKK